MVKISKTSKQFSSLATPTLAAANILEVSDLQEYIFNSPDAFCKELGQQLKIIAKEVRPSETVDDRIDLLAVDEEGNLVIIELKRGSEKLQLLQAIAYVGMAAKWTPERIRQEALKFNRADMISDFEDENLNREQRILLLAEAYDYEVLVAAEWLYEKDVELDCVRVALAVDGDSKYLTFTQIFPTPELAEQARKRGSRGPAASPMYASWEEALATVTNGDVAQFFKHHLGAGVENKLKYLEIDFTEGRIHVYLHSNYASVVQWCSRFIGDVEFWRSLVSSHEVSTWTKVRKDDCLRFRLSTAEDFAVFQEAINSKLKTVQWSNAPADLLQATSA